MIPFAYNLRSLAVRRATTIATALGIALVVFVFACTLMLLAGLRRTLSSAGHAEVMVILRDGSEAELTSQFERELADRVSASSEVQLAVSEVVVTMSMERLQGGGISNLVLRGITTGSAALRPELRIIAGRDARPGTDEAIIGRAIRARFRSADLGGRLDLGPQRSVQVVGIFESSGSALESEVWADRDIVSRAVGREGLISSVRVRMDPKQADLFITRVANERTLGLAAEREVDYFDRQNDRMSGFILGIGLMLSLCFALGGMIGAAITMHASIARRQREIGTLRALGFSRTNVLIAFLLEALLLALGGGLVGVAAALAMSRIEFSLVNVANWSEIVFAFRPTVGVLAVALGFAALMGLLGGLGPALRAARVPPVRAMRG